MRHLHPEVRFEPLHSGRGPHFVQQLCAPKRDILCFNGLGREGGEPLSRGLGRCLCGGEARQVGLMQKLGQPGEADKPWIATIGHFRPLALRRIASAKRMAAATGR